MDQNHTDVNYDAVNLDPTQGPSDPYDDAMAFRSLLGAVHGEFNNIVNNNITSTSNSLRPIDGKEILEKGVRELVAKKQTPDIPLISEAPPVNNPEPVPPPAQQPTENLFEQVQPQVITSNKQKSNDNQLEFNFDYSATAQKIYDSLESIEAKLDKLLKGFNAVTIRKKRTTTKTSEPKKLQNIKKK